MPKVECGTLLIKPTLESGQFFRFKETDEGYQLDIQGGWVEVEQKGSYLHFNGTSRKIISGFFRLDDDLEEMRAEICVDENMTNFVEEIPGLGLLRQNPWTCALSFLLSSASNIPRITALMDKVGKLDHSKLKDELLLRNLGCGFRAKYISAFAKKVNIDTLKSLKQFEYPDAKAKLCTYPGIGEKIADCILLFSLDFLEAFPVDTWIEKAMIHHYFGGIKTSHDDIRSLAADKFRKLAGFAQQYIYHHARTISKF